MLDGIGDRIRNAIEMMIGDSARLGGLALAALIILGLLIGSAYLPSMIIQGKLSSSISQYCNKPYYVLPFFTNGVNTFLIETEVQCLGISSPLIQTLVLWYLEVLALVLIGVFAGIIIWDLQG